MASIRKRERKDGYVYIIESKYNDPLTGKTKTMSKTWKPDRYMTQREIEKELKIKSIDFDDEVRQFVSNANKIDLNKNRLTFEELSQLWLDKVSKDHSIIYIQKHKSLLNFVNKDIGKLQITNIEPETLQDYYDKLDSRIRITEKVYMKENFKDVLKEHNYSYGILKRMNKIELVTYTLGLRGDSVSFNWAVKFSELTNIPFNELFDRTTIKKKYSNETNMKYKKIIRMVLGYGKKLRLIKENYGKSDYIDFPKVKKNKIDVMDEEEISKFYNAVITEEDIRIKTSMMIFLLTGLRRGEVCALSWEDISFEKKTLSVNTSLVRVTGLGVIEKDPKTVTSSRTITIPEILIEQLELYKKWQIDNSAMIEIKSKHRLFFSSQFGLMSPDIFEVWMRKMIKRANIPHHSLHSLRHTNVALQIAAGIDIVTVSQRVGHARTSTTSDIYAYMLQNTDQVAAQAINNIFNSSNKEMSENNELEEYKKTKEEMKKYGFDSYDEYLDYIKYKLAKAKQLM